MFYRSYLPDIPHYYFNNTSGIFHYFQIYDSKTKTFGKYDTKYIRIFMSRLYKTYQESQDNLHENEHWVYGQCRNGIDNKNMDKYIFDGSNTSKRTEFRNVSFYSHNDVYIVPIAVLH